MDEPEVKEESDPVEEDAEVVYDPGPNEMRSALRDEFYREEWRNER